MLILRKSYVYEDSHNDIKRAQFYNTKLLSIQDENEVNVITLNFFLYFTDDDNDDDN